MGSPPMDLCARETDALARAQRVREVVALHYEFVWRSLRRLGVHESAADDGAQEVFCVFARRQAEVPAAKEKSFLFGVAMRIAQVTRRRGRRDASMVDVVDDATLVSVPTPSANPDEMVDEARARAALDAIVSALPMDLRAVFVLYEIEEMTMAEIATVLDLPSGTVASRLRRAREAFEQRAAAHQRGLR